VQRDDSARKGGDRREGRTRNDVDARRELSHEFDVHLSQADTVEERISRLEDGKGERATETTYE
jgi:hypothetical protein